MRASWLAAAMMLVATMALGHETMGSWGSHGMMEYLYGHRIGNPPDGGKVNCCLFNNGTEGSRGDCQRYPDEDVKIVPGGYLLKDGEFISHAETSVSPQDPATGEYHFYRCRHTPGSGYGDSPATHCWFAPPTGS
jgi:hypothetical protein